MLYLTLILAGLSGATLSHRLLGLRHPFMLVAVGLTLGLYLQLTLLNAALWVGIGLTGSLLLSSLLLLASAAGTWKLTSEEPRETSIHPLEILVVAVAALVLAVITNASQMGLPDQDYWIHTALQAHMLHGEFPPKNPFFPHLILNGHYGRDLFIVAATHLSGWDTFRAQMIFTSFFQAWILVTFYAGVRHQSGSALQSVLSSIFMMLGLNVFYRAGVIDTFAAHAPASYLGLFLVVFLLVELIRNPTGGRAVLAGIVVGNHAMVYSTNFVLILFTLGPWLLSLRASREQLKMVALSLGLALLVAGSQGGALSHFTGRLLSMSAPRSQAEQNQSQSIRVKFPKSPFLTLAVHTTDRIYSCAYEVPPAKQFLKAFDGDGARSTYRYVPIYSWEIWRCHWIAVFLAPFSWFLLQRKRHQLGLYFWWYGFFGTLIPCTFDFGIVHEVDWMRWVLATGLGMTVALGLALGQLLDSTRGHWRWLAYPSMLVLVWLNTLAGVQFLKTHAFRNIQTQGGWLRVATLGVTTDQWMLQHNHFLRLQQPDINAFNFLRENSQPLQRILVNFRERDAWDILFESTLAGRTGLFPTGHAYPLDNDPIGLPPFRMDPRARAFLNQPSSPLMRQVPFDWLYLRLPPAESHKFEVLPELTVVFKEYSPLDRLERTLLKRQELPESIP